MFFDNIYLGQEQGNNHHPKVAPKPGKVQSKPDVFQLKENVLKKLEQEIEKIKIAKLEGRIYLSGVVFKTDSHSRKIVDISATSDRVKYKIHSGPQKGLENICDLKTFKEEIKSMKK